MLARVRTSHSVGHWDDWCSVDSHVLLAAFKTHHEDVGYVTSVGVTSTLEASTLLLL